MRKQAEALASDLAELVRRAQGDRRRARQAASMNIAAIANDRARMAALIEERQKQQAEREAALDAERARAADLARQADNLKDLIAKLEQGLDTATRAAREAAAHRYAAAHWPALRRTPAGWPRRSPLRHCADKFRFRLTALKSAISAPRTALGGVEKGLSIATRAGAQVTAPATAGLFMPDRSAPTANS